jgi:hypothetical protein
MPIGSLAAALEYNSKKKHGFGQISTDKGLSALRFGG